MVDIVKNNIAAIHEICKKHRAELLYLFGSGARQFDFDAKSGKCMQHDKEKYFQDIKISLEVLINFSHSVSSLEEYENLEILVKNGVCRRLAIIGEAMYVLNHLDRNFSVTDKKKIIGLRHIIVHDYDKVNDAIVYAIL